MDIKESLKKIVGINNVSDDKFEIEAYSRSWGCPTIPREPIVVVRPSNKEQIQEIVRFANENKIPVSPIGGKSNCIDAWPKGVIMIDMTSMHKLLEVDEVSYTVTVEAGMHWGELFYELRKRGFTTGWNIHSYQTATVGGAVALCANGPTEIRYGLIGEQVVCLEVILPGGEIINTGSRANPMARKFQRYCYGSDLTGLFIGSNGIFGIITEVTFKLYHLPETRKYFGYQYKTMEATARTAYEVQKHAIPNGGIPIEKMYITLGREGLEARKPPIHAEGMISPLVMSGTKKEIEFYEKIVEKICLKEGKLLDEEVYQPLVSPSKRTLSIEVHPKRKDGVYQPLAVNFCSNLPTLDVPKVGREFMKMYREFGVEKYKIYPNLLFTGNVCNRFDVTFSFGLSFDYRDLNSRGKTRELIEKYYDLGLRLGLAPHYIGQLRQNVIMPKLGTTYQVLKTIKKSLDPNNIMNPGLLMLD